MPSVYDYRHIELDRVGSGKKRITQPPGGDTSDIFGRKSSMGGESNGRGSGHSTPVSSAPSTPRRGSLAAVDTKNRLFGEVKVPVTRRIRDNITRSSIFSPAPSDAVDSASSTPTKVKQTKAYVRRNPITGEIQAVAVAPKNNCNIAAGSVGGSPNGSSSPGAGSVVSDAWDTHSNHGIDMSGLTISCASSDTGSQ